MTSMSIREWWLQRSHWPDVGLSELVELKGDQSVSVVIPARNEEPTIGHVVEEVVRRLVPAGLVDEVVVMDGRSIDETASISAAAGARVIDVPEVAHGHAVVGKGGSIWLSQFETSGDIVVLLDADVSPSRANTVAALLTPLLTTPSVHFVKAAFDRPLTVDGVLHHGSGGRVTELLARPVLSQWWPELAAVVQPLAGELAVRRGLLETLSFSSGYALEIGMLLDVHAALGLEGMAQVDIGERVHRHHSDAALGRMAAGIFAAILERRGEVPGGHDLIQYSRVGEHLLPAATPVGHSSLPPARSIAVYARG